ncbi:hypothetical protein GCM10009830_05260 [Glycomyces endophyticus]|uniref:Uncharacterized protein n=1 Tax=Glycomyces endophyticus TaxID=480996 RepID=A0ABP4RXV1_9ACTN
MAHERPVLTGLRAAAEPLAILAWIVVTAVGWTVGTSGNDHNESSWVSQLRLAVLLVAVVVAAVGPVVIALLSFWNGRRLAGWAFLAAGLGIGALLLGSGVFAGVAGAVTGYP